MIIYPAIDLRGGRVVRLTEGKFDQEKSYGDDPLAVARGFAAAGAENGLMTEARNIIVQTLEQSSEEEKRDWGLIKEKIRQDLKRYINKNTQRRPLIMPVILEI